VVGSTSHFSVLFSTDSRVNEESDEEALLTRVQRAFKSVDTDECGFVMEAGLEQILGILGVDFASNKTSTKRLSKHLELEGGIILWSTFWETISKLLTGTSLDDILSPKKIRSDSDIARELYDDERSISSGDATMTTRPRSDSEFARQLQDEWNSEESRNDAISTNSPISPIKKITRHRSDSVAGKDAEKFVLYHYNGFSGASGSILPPKMLTRLTLYRRSQENNIGQSIAFSSGGAVFSGSANVSPIEEVLRTRWPGCRLEWLGNEPRLD